MPNAIERDVYVLRNTLKNPISYVRGTDLLPIIFHFRDFTIPSGATATAFTAKPDGNAVYGSAVISGNDVTIDVTQQMFIVLGMSMLQVEIKEGEETLTTFIQPVMVEPNLKAGDLPESTTDIEFLDEAIEQAQEAVKDAQQAIADANTAISGANTAAESANSAAQNANNAAEELQDKVDAGDFTASVQVGTTTTLEPNQDATVSNSGTNKDAVLNFGIPKGDPGTAASIQIGTTQTVQPEENAEVINTGTASAAVLDFKIPRGADGMTDLTAEYTDASEYTCQPTANAPVVVKELDGKTEQVETTGAQLLNAKYEISFTLSKYFGSATFSETLLYPGTYTISVDKIESNDTDSNYSSVYMYGDNTKDIILIWNNIQRGTKQSKQFTVPSGKAVKMIYLYSGDNYDNSQGDTATYYGLMLNAGSEPLPYEPYTGGQPAPSPDYPQAIKGVGGMGYFDGEWVQGNISSTGTIGTETTGITSANAIPCKQNNNIAVTYEDSIDVIAVAFYNASGAYISTSTSGNSVDTFTATAPANAAIFKVNLRVVSGSTITPNGAKYCTVTINGEYQTGVEVHGAQLFDASKLPSKTQGGATVTNNGDGSFTISGSGTMNDVLNIKYQYTHEETVKILKSGNIFLKDDIVATYPLLQIYLQTDSGAKNELKNSTGGSKTSNVLQETLNDESCVLVLQFYGLSGQTIVPGTIKPMLYQGGDGTYQPYHHTAISIPLTSPLYEGDKICYVKPGERYIDENGDTVVADRMLYGVYRENAVIKSYNSEEIPGEYKSSAGELTTGAEVVYKLAQPWLEPFEDQSIFYTLRTADTLSYVYSSDPIKPNVTVEVAKNSTGGYLLESYAQAQKNAISEANSQSRISAIEQQLVNQATTPTE